MINSIGFSNLNTSYYQSSDSIGVSTDSISREVDFQKKLISREIQTEIQGALKELNTLNSPISDKHILYATNQNSSFNEVGIEKGGVPKMRIDTSTSALPPTTQNNIEMPNSNVFKYNAAIKDASHKYNVPENLIHSVIKAESGYNEKAKSGVGALGLMQLMPATAASLGVTNPMNPIENINGGVKYLSQMIKRYDGNISLALAAYNAGPGNVDKFGGIPPFEETQDYVKKILNA